LGTITAAVLYGARRRKFLLVGWLWYLVTLLPVIGLIQVGSQARADRYTYLPLIGIFVILAWCGAEIAAHWRRSRPILVTLAVLVLAALCVATRAQVALWKDSPTLLRHAIAVTQDAYQAHSLLANALAKSGAYAEALPHFQRVVEGLPGNADARYGLGLTLLRAGDVDGAIVRLEEALRIDPNHARAHDQLGYAYGLRSDFPRALEHYESLVRLQPDDPLAWRNLAIVRFQVGRLAEAAEGTTRALALAEASGREDLIPGLREQERAFRAAASGAAEPSER
jgi:tetratricopeptide (TPR) repeat protein